MPYLEYLVEIIKNPQETWATWYRNETTGKISLRHSFIRRVIVPGRKNGKDRSHNFCGGWLC